MSFNNFNVFDSSLSESESVLEAKLLMITEMHSNPEKTMQILRQLKLTSKDCILLEGIPPWVHNEIVFQNYDLEEYKRLFEETGVFIAGWDSVQLCEKVEKMRDTINMGNDEEFETLMLLTITERNKVMIRTINSARKNGFRRIVVVIGSAHYDELTSSYCEQSPIKYAWIS